MTLATFQFLKHLSSSFALSDNSPFTKYRTQAPDARISYKRPHISPFPLLAQKLDELLKPARTAYSALSRTPEIMLGSHMRIQHALTISSVTNSIIHQVPVHPVRTGIPGWLNHYNSASLDNNDSHR